jgi:two-component system sensor histidine kinase QseC
MRSLSLLLFLALMSVLLVGTAASGWAAYRTGLIEASELFDAKLAHSARVLRGLVDQALPGHLETPDQQPLEIAVWSGVAEGDGDDLALPDGHAYETKLAFQVFAADGRALLRSDNAPHAPLADLRPGFSERQLDGVRWRTFAIASSRGHWYLSGEREDVRGEIASEIAQGILRPLLIELPLLAVLVGIIIHLGQRSLRRVTAEVQARAVNQLQQIDDRRVPLEIRGLVAAINRLLAALDGALRHERQFTADAAHELRTPLAALRLHLSNLTQSDNDTGRQQSERHLAQGISRLERLVSQLLTLSRLEPGSPIALRPVHLAPIARTVIAELVDAGLANGVDLGLDVECDGSVQGDELSLGVLLRNLLDNALRYSPRPGQVQARIACSAGTVLLCIEDSGPGIDTELQQRVFDRFYRQPGSASDGSGLGLSIVRRIAELHGANVALSRSAQLGGLRVDVQFRWAEVIDGITAT